MFGGKEKDNNNIVLGKVRARREESTISLSSTDKLQGDAMASEGSESINCMT